MTTKNVSVKFVFEAFYPCSVSKAEWDDKDKEKEVKIAGGFVTVSIGTNYIFTQIAVTHTTNRS